MTADIAAFVAANLDRWEHAARAATPGPWLTGTSARHLGDDVVYGLPDWTGRIVHVCNTGSAGQYRQANADHIAAHDPEAVLRLVATMRRIVERHEPSHSPDLGEPPARCMGCDNISPCADLRNVASMWGDAEGWDPAWAVEE